MPTRRNPGYDSPPRKERRRCPVEGCRRYVGTHDHVQPERSPARERVVYMVIAVPMFGNEDQVDSLRLNIARQLHYSIGANVTSAPVEVWDEQHMPDAAYIYFGDSALAPIPQEEL